MSKPGIVKIITFDHHGTTVRVVEDYNGEFHVVLKDILKVVDFRGAGWKAITRNVTTNRFQVVERGGGNLCVRAVEVYKLRFRDSYRLDALDDLVGTVNKELNIKQEVVPAKKEKPASTITSEPDPYSIRFTSLDGRLDTLAKYITELLDENRALNARVQALENGQCKAKDQLTLADVASVLETIKPIL